MYHCQLLQRWTVFHLYLSPTSAFCLFLSLQHVFSLIVLFSLLCRDGLSPFSVSQQLSVVYFLTLISASIHSCFLSRTLVLSATWLAEDLATSTPPKPTKARRFLLPFVFCSDSPPNGTIRTRAEEHMHQVVMWQTVTDLWMSKVILL